MVDQDDAEKPRLERRMLAIMATDVVGFSRQMEHDEVGTIARVNAARVEVLEPLLARHHGRLIKLMGDGTLSVFDSVVDAVNCAAAIQRAAAERNQAASDSEHLVMRIGVNLGDVVLQDNDVYGDGVNVAARLEPLCDPGGIMISGTAFDHLQGKVDFPLEFAGEQQVKNISRPVRAYRARLDGIAAPPPARRRRFSLPLRPLAAVATAAAVGGRRMVGLVGLERPAGQRLDRRLAVRQSGRRRRDRSAGRRDDRGPDHRADPLSRPGRDRPRCDPRLQGQGGGRPPGRPSAARPSTSWTVPSSAKANGYGFRRG